MTEVHYTTDDLSLHPPDNRWAEQTTHDSSRMTISQH
jgi:hypothetical protein